VERVLDLLQAELIRIMQLAGTASIAKITPTHVTRKTR
jgi:isopentenyl diphosphate isomerase/L-lactate dehydrogenase-like FMN-dependent dehydrogenase